MRLRLGGHEADGQAAGAGARGASDAVGVVGGRARQVVVDDDGQERDVDAARGQVGGDHHVPAPRFEFVEHGLACALAHLAVKSGGKDASEVELVGHVLTGVACGHEHQHSLLRVLGDELTQQGGALFVVHGDGALGDVGRLRLGTLDADAHRIAQPSLGQALHCGQKGRAEQEVLPLGGQQREHALQFLGKTQVKQTVGLVQDQLLHSVQAQGVVGHDVEQAPGRGHHHIGAAAKAHHLRVDRHATKERAHFDRLRQRPRQVAQHIADLCGQLTRGHQHQH